MPSAFSIVTGSSSRSASRQSVEEICRVRELSSEKCVLSENPVELLVINVPASWAEHIVIPW